MRTKEDKVIFSLGEEHEVLSQLFWHAEDSILSKTLEGIVVSWNPSSEKIYGYSAKEIIGKHINITIPEYKQNEHKEILLSLKKGKQINNFVTERVRKDGKIIYVSLTISPIKNKKGELVGAFTIGRDITKFKLAEKERRQLAGELQETHEFIQKVTDFVPGIISVNELETRKNLWTNKGLTEVLGYTGDEIREMGPDLGKIIVHPNDFYLFSEREEKLKKIKEGETFITEGRVKHKNGYWVWLRSKATVFKRNEKGEAIQSISLAEDITELKQKQIQLEESEGLVRGILNAITEVLMCLKAVRNKKGEIINFEFVLINKTGEEFLGSSSLELKGKSLLKKFPGIKKEGIFDIAKKVVETGKPAEFEKFYNHEKYNNWIYMNIIKYQDDVLMAVRDITELRKVQEQKDSLLKELKELNVALEKKIKERTEKLEQYTQSLKREIAEKESIQKKVEETNKELSGFASIVSHDLRAPLRAFSTLSQWILTDEGDKLTEDSREHLQTMIEKSASMAEMLQGILDYSKAEQGKSKKEEINLNDEIQRIIKNLTIPPNFEIKVKPGFPTIIANRTQIEQIFQNLIDNAVKYMDKPVGFINIGFEQKKGFYKFGVADNGPGIEEKDLNKIFEMFHVSSKNITRKDSTGVGLAIVKKIVKVNGGDIWVESKLGEGSTFYFTLPHQ